jgi:hypothetical protein
MRLRTAIRYVTLRCITLHCIVMRWVGWSSIGAFFTYSFSIFTPSLLFHHIAGLFFINLLPSGVKEQVSTPYFFLYFDYLLIASLVPLLSCSPQCSLVLSCPVLLYPPLDFCLFLSVPAFSVKRLPLLHTSSYQSNSNYHSTNFTHLLSSLSNHSSSPIFPSTHFSLHSPFLHSYFPPFLSG